MHVLITAATLAEIQPVADHLARTGGHISNWQAELLITAPGMVPVTYELTRYLAARKPALVIQAGIAGSFQLCLPGKTVVIKDESFADLGVWEDAGFRNLFDLGLARASQPPYNGTRLVNPFTGLMAATGLETASGVTVNEISTVPARIKWVEQNLSPFVESMEGAAFHYVCLQEQVAFLQLRSVSNLVGERDKSRWHIAEAIDHLNKAIFDLLNRLSAYNEAELRF